MSDTQTKRAPRAKITQSKDNPAIFVIQGYVGAEPTEDSVTVDVAAYLNGGASFESLNTMGQRLLVHGAKQKIADSWSAKDTIVLDEARAMDQLLRDGVWSQRGESAERTTLLFLALTKHYGWDATPEKLANRKTRFAAMVEADDPWIKAHRADVGIKALMVKIQQEKLAERAKALRDAAKSAPRPTIADMGDE